RHGSKIWTGIAAAMRTIVSFLPPQPGATKLVLVATFARFEVTRLIRFSPRGKRRPMDVGRTRPNSAPSSARGADVVIHLPAWPKLIAFISLADGIDHLTSNDVTKISQAVERFERSYLRAKTLHSFTSGIGNLLTRVTTTRIDTLLIP